MTVLKNGNRWDKSNVLFQDGKLIEYNKSFPTTEMEHIDYGLGILSDEVLIKYPLGDSLDLADVYHQLSLSGLLTGFEVNERFYEIGSHSGIRETERYFLSQEK
jgi:hypothetical protein